jgi:UDP-N-acetylglucosamine--N-acetylmuramyl-(pentapeptide) pyrophosphoryl-undecaprenol N-acetylglucosamine transferase
VFVPLPIGNGEQALNARAVIEAGGGLLVDDATLSPDWIASYVVPLLTDAPRLQTMGAAAAHLIPLDADEKLARMILEAAQ